MLFKQNARVGQPAKTTSEDVAAAAPEIREHRMFKPDGDPSAVKEREQRMFKPDGDQSAVKEPEQRMFKPDGDASAAKDPKGNVLIVGEGIKLKGEITACDRLVVEGHVEVSLNETRAVEIRPSGRFIGSCEVEEAEISGVYEGELTVRGRLVVHATGRATGKIQYGEIELERGGRIAGELSVRESGKSVAAKMIESVQAEKSVVTHSGQKVA